MKKNFQLYKTIFQKKIYIPIKKTNKKNKTKK